MSMFCFNAAALQCLVCYHSVCLCYLEAMRHEAAPGNDNKLAVESSLTTLAGYPKD